VTPPILPADLLSQCARALGSSPAGGIDRRSLEPLLASALLGPVARDEYLAALAGATRPDAKPGVNASDLPLDRVVREGLGVLPDALLFAVARSDAAVRELNRLVDLALADGTAGKYWEQAELLPDESIPGDYHAAAESAVREVKRLDRDTRADRSEPNTTSRDREKTHSRWVAAAMSVGIAASLALAFVLGTQWPAGDGPREVRLASVAVRGDVTRGIEDVAIDVTNGSDRRAFLTVVGLAPGRKSPALYYRHEGRYLDVSPRGKTSVSNLPPEFEGTTVLFVISTPVPAGGVVREVAPAGMSAETAERDADRVKQALADLGIVADVKVVPIPAGKR
jgi:hypothetical protein